jgi:hypothetical protein
MEKMYGPDILAYLVDLEGIDEDSNL